MDRSARGVSVSWSVEVLWRPVGSVTPVGGVTVGVLLSVPVRAGSMATVNWKLEVLVGITVPVVKWTVFVPASKVAPFVAETKETPVGRTSLTAAPMTVLGPLF